MQMIHEVDKSPAFKDKVFYKWIRSTGVSLYSDAYQWEKGRNRMLPNETFSVLGESCAPGLHFTSGRYITDFYPKDCSIEDVTLAGIRVEPHVPMLSFTYKFRAPEVIWIDEPETATWARLLSDPDFLNFRLGPNLVTQEFLLHILQNLRYPSREASEHCAALSKTICDGLLQTWVSDNEANLEVASKRSSHIDPQCLFLEPDLRRFLPRAPICDLLQRARRSIDLESYFQSARLTKAFHYEFSSQELKDRLRLGYIVQCIPHERLIEACPDFIVTQAELQEAGLAFSDIVYHPHIVQAWKPSHADAVAWLTCMRGCPWHTQQEIQDYVAKVLRPLLWDLDLVAVFFDVLPAWSMTARVQATKLASRSHKDLGNRVGMLLTLLDNFTGHQIQGALHPRRQPYRQLFHVLSELTASTFSGIIPQKVIQEACSFVQFHSKHSSCVVSGIDALFPKGSLLEGWRRLKYHHGFLHESILHKFWTTWDSTLQSLPQQFGRSPASLLYVLNVSAALHGKTHPLIPHPRPTTGRWSFSGAQHINRMESFKMRQKVQFMKTQTLKGTTPKHGWRNPRLVGQARHQKQVPLRRGKSRC